MIGEALSVLLSVGIVLNGLRLRSRVEQLGQLPRPDGQVDAKFAALVAEGVSVDDATFSAASVLARSGSMELVDLVPADMPTVQALDVARTIDPLAWRRDLLAPGRGAGHAVLASKDLLDRAGMSAAEAMPAGDLVELGARLKGYALRAADVAVAPALPAAPYGRGSRATYLRAVGVPIPLAVALPMAVYGLLALATVLRPWWGVAAFALYSLQPCLILARGRLSPPDLRSATAFRVLKEPLVWLATLRGGSPPPRHEEVDRREAARAGYALDLRDGTDRFFESPRSTCPWCGGASLRKVLSTGDRFQRKPGTFTVEECRACSHVFQNPRLSMEGLEFYYRDFYDGLGGPAADWVFRTGASCYRQRAEMVRPHGVPERWLDVGAGHGHFCVVARDIWPETAFDGLDMGEAIEDAQRKGWVGRGYRGQFRELAAELVGQYDVVSMHHYLEHTRDPRAELDAAASVVVQGGLLLVEVPDPEWRPGRILGSHWVPWLQPQHQHLVPIGNLKQALLDRGLTPIAEDRGAAHQNNDYTGAAFLVMASLWPDVRSPWSTRPPTPARRLQAATAVAVGAPLIAAGVAVDAALKPFLRQRGRGNAYRVLARRE